MSYTKDDYVKALREAGITQGDLIMVHTGMSSLRDVPKGVRTQDVLSSFVAEGLFEVVGESGTVCVPSFTYSLGANEIYDKYLTPTRDIGAFPEYFWHLPGVIRSDDPFLAVAAKGPMAEEILQEHGHTSFGHSSFFDRFIEAGGKIVTIGVGIRWATIRYHFIEMAQAPFRYKKFFSGSRMENGISEYCEWIYSVAPLADKIDKISRESGFIVEDILNKEENSPLKRAPLARGYINCIDGGVFRKFMVDMLKADPWISGEGINSIDQIISEERERTGTEKYSISLDSSDEHELADKLTNVSRHLLSDGYDAALNAISQQFSIKIHEYLTGYQAFKWIVPERYIFNKAEVKDPEDKIIFSSDRSPFIVPSYSKPFDGNISSKQLDDHLYYSDDIFDSNFIPYKSSCYNRDWGLCVSKEQRELFTTESYHVTIDSCFSFDKAKVGELFVPGKEKETVLFSTHLDGPYQFNYGLSGVIAGLKLFEKVRAINDLNYSYRFLIAPENVGLACWLTENQKLKIKAIINLDLLATADSNYYITESELADSWINKLAKRVLGAEAVRVRPNNDILNNAYRYRQNDGKHLFNYFDGSEFNCPVITITRRKSKGNRPYPEFHTDADTVQNADFDILKNSEDDLLELIKGIEKS